MAETMNPIDAAQYLAKYGWLGEVRMADARVEMLADGEALGEFQAFAGLPVTGLLDAETVAQMQLPRCGVPDIGRLSSPGAALAAKWRKTGLTYFIEKSVPQLDVNTVSRLIWEAFGSWSEVAGIKFTETFNRVNADLIVSTGSGPADNFDGPGKVLAWAFLPNGNDGQLLMRFDAAESWTVSGNGIRFPNVAAHEFGHMLGLEHSRVQTALMAAFYSPSIAKPQPNDDIPRIQALYGPPVVGPDPKPGNTICDMVRECLKQFNTLRKAEKFTMAGIQFDESDRQALNKLVEAATNPTCQKITELLAKIAAVCPAQALRRCDPEPAVGGGMCAGLTGILQLLPMLQELLKMCKPTA